MNYRSVTLDLDGTLVDSVSDLTLACQAMLAELGEPPTDQAEIFSFVGEGMVKLVTRCLARTSPPDETRLAAGVAAFRQHYAVLNGQTAQIYPGVTEALEHWQQTGVPLACVTNKPVEFTLPLLERLNLSRFFPVVVGGDSTPHKKPHPEPILYACRQMGIAPENNLHIGDSRHDLAAARAAGCLAGGIPYGYHGASPLTASECDVLLPTLFDFTRL